LRHLVEENEAIAQPGELVEHDVVEVVASPHELSLSRMSHQPSSNPPGNNPKIETCPGDNHHGGKDWLRKFPEQTGDI